MSGPIYINPSDLYDTNTNVISGTVGIGTTNPYGTLEVDRGSDTNYVTDRPPVLNTSHFTNLNITPQIVTDSVLHTSTLGASFSNDHNALSVALNDGAPGNGDHVGIASLVWFHASSTGGGTGGDDWAFWGVVQNDGYASNAICLELDSMNTNNNYMDANPRLAVPSSGKFMYGIQLIPGPNGTGNHCTRAISIAPDFNTGFATGIALNGFVDTGIFLNSQIPWRNPPANTDQTQPVGLRFGTSLTNLARICTEDANSNLVDVWGIMSPSDRSYVSFQNNMATSPTDVLVLNNSGNVGIGTTQPANMLSVVSNGTMTQAIFGQGISSACSQIAIGTQDSGIGDSLICGFDPTNYFGYMQISGDPIGSGLVVTYGNNQGGSVGIGTTNPAQKTHIQTPGANALQYALELQNLDGTNSGGTATGILFSTEGSGNFGKGAIVYERRNSWAMGTMHFLQNQAYSQDIPALSDAVMSILNNGSVGIGTTNPNSSLHIAPNSGNGYITMEQLSSAPAAPGAGKSVIYMYNNHLYARVGTGNPVQLA